MSTLAITTAAIEDMATKEDMGIKEVMVVMAGTGIKEDMHTETVMGMAHINMGTTDMVIINTEDMVIGNTVDIEATAVDVIKDIIMATGVMVTSLVL